MNNRTKAYTYLLTVVNKEIKTSLILLNLYKNSIAKEVEDYNYNYEKKQIIKYKLYLKELKEIKRFLIEEKRFENTFENAVINFFQGLVKLYENSKN